MASADASTVGQEEAWSQAFTGASERPGSIRGGADTRDFWAAVAVYSFSQAAHPLPTPYLVVNTRVVTGDSSRLWNVVAGLEREIEMLHNSIAEQRSFIMSGYIVNVRPDIGGGYVAHCPTLHAVADGESFNDSVGSLREAMEISIEGRRHFGSAIPPKDTEELWPD